MAGGFPGNLSSMNRHTGSDSVALIAFWGKLISCLMSACTIVKISIWEILSARMHDFNISVCKTS